MSGARHPLCSPEDPEASAQDRSVALLAHIKATARDYAEACERRANAAHARSVAQLEEDRANKRVASAQVDLENAVAELEKRLTASNR